MKKQQDLEDEFVFQNKQPWAFLAGQNVDEITAQKTLEIFKLEIKNLDQKKVFFSKQPGLNHKQKSLRLFFAGLYISSRCGRAQLCLGQLDVLGERLKQSDLPHDKVVLSETQSEDFKNWQPATGMMYVGLGPQVYLEALGFMTTSSQLNGSDYAKKILSDEKNQTGYRLKAV